MRDTNVLRMDNVGIVVESLENAILFFSEIGLTLDGRTTVNGHWAGSLTGLGNQTVEIAMMSTPDGHSKIELSKFIEPEVVENHTHAPVNALGYLRVMFAVKDVNNTVKRLQRIGAELVGDIVNYRNQYRLCYIRSAEGLLVGLAEELNP